MHKNYYICHFCIFVFPQSLSFICLCSVSLTILSLLHNAIGMFNHLNLLWPPNFQIKYLGAGRYFMEKKCVVTLAVGNNFNREKCSLKEAQLSLPYKLHNPCEHGRPLRQLLTGRRTSEKQGVCRLTQTIFAEQINDLFVFHYEY